MGYFAGGDLVLGHTWAASRRRLLVANTNAPQMHLRRPIRSRDGESLARTHHTPRSQPAVRRGPCMRAAACTRGLTTIITARASGPSFIPPPCGRPPSCPCYSSGCSSLVHEVPISRSCASRAHLGTRPPRRLLQKPLALDGRWSREVMASRAYPSSSAARIMTESRPWLWPSSRPSSRP